MLNVYARTQVRCAGGRTPSTLADITFRTNTHAIGCIRTSGGVSRRTFVPRIIHLFKNSKQ